MGKILTILCGLFCASALCGCSASDLSILGPIAGFNTAQSQQESAMNAAMPGAVSAAQAAEFERQADNGATFQLLWTRLSPYPFERQERANLRAAGEGDSLVTGGDYGYLRFAAERGDAEGEFYLAVLYSNLSTPGTNGVFGQIPDPSVPLQSPEYTTFYNILRKHAIFWLNKAAHSQVAEAQYLLAGMYQTGTGATIDTAKALQWFTQSAKQGYAPAQFALGRIYMTGVDGAVVDQARGFALIHSAAQAGLPEAEYETARAYQNGWGVAANSSRMQYWLTLAYNAHLPAAEQMQEQIWLAPLLASARAGDVHSQCALGCCYLNGRFHHQAIPPHPRQAVRWFRKAAIAGNSGAECNLGYCYQNGLGVASTNYAKALHWYEAAIKLGNVDAENNIGTMYQSGEGLPQDDNKAIYWYSTAARGGNITARNNIREMMRAAIRANPTQPLTQQQREWIQGAIGVQIYEQYQQQMEAEEAQQQADAAADNASPPDPDEITPDDEIMPDDEGPGP